MANRAIPSSRKCSRGSRSQRFKRERKEGRNPDCSAAGCASSTTDKEAFIHQLPQAKVRYIVQSMLSYHWGLGGFGTRPYEKGTQTGVNRDCWPQQNPRCTT